MIHASSSMMGEKKISAAKEIKTSNALRKTGTRSASAE
jgi:hypothetical protein